MSACVDVAVALAAAGVGFFFFAAGVSLLLVSARRSARGVTAGGGEKRSAVGRILE